MNFDHFIYNKAALPSDENEKREFFEQLEQQFCEELKNSETAQEYFKNYSPYSVESFIKFYASKKAMLSQYYQFYADTYHEKENLELHFQKKAEDMFCLILQKKLFNLQLQWRAGQLDIDWIDTCYDFQFWEDHILSCPFIPAVSKYEIDVMKEYLLRFEENDDAKHHYNRWQDYDSITKKEENGLMDDFPDWYEFYDSRMGTGMLLLLPNHKGTKENFYFDLFHEDSNKNNPPITYPPSAPYLAGFMQELLDFSKFFEKDKYFITLFKYYKYHQDKESRDPNYDDVVEAIQLLFEADRPVYCHNHLTWDKAIVAAAKEYKNTKIVEMLDFVFEEYLMMKELGFSKDRSLEEIKEEYNKDNIAQLFRKHILKGRVLNGEPEDFNY